MKYYIAYYTHHGDDWRTNYHDVFKSEKEANDFEKEHREEMENVSGVEYIEFTIKEVNESQLRGTLTVREYCELFPEVKKLIDQYHENN
ncbi:hypothetical protein WKH56_20490 [Priestia sp. SB1]|uniref:hypothetical protein n=1 Tax=Priestia sp. SB1 TaxID=3132359 RepID=UPI00317DEACC